MAAVSVKFLGDITQLRRAIDTAKGEAVGMGSKFKGALGSMKLPALAAGAALFKLAQDAGETADALFDMQDQTGISTDKLQEMRYVADQAGVAQDFYADAVKEVIKANDRIARGTGPAAEALEAMGIAAKNADGSMRGAEEITDEVIQGLLGIEDASKRAAYAEDIFKRKSDQLLPVLGLGEEALAGMRQEAHELGVVQSGEALDAANEYRQNMEKLEAALQVLVNALMESLLPAVTDYVIPALIWLAEKAGDVEHAIESFGDVIFGTMDEIAAAANAAPKHWDGFTAKLKEVDEQARVTGGGVRTVAEAVKMTADEMRKATDPAFALRKANEEYKEAQQTVAALQASGRTNTAEYQDAVAGLLEEQADLNYATEQYEEAGGAAAEGLFELGEQARITREEVEALIFAMENLNRTRFDAIDIGVNIQDPFESSFLREYERRSGIYNAGARRP